jgi:hypothetical protein
MVEGGWATDRRAGTFRGFGMPQNSCRHSTSLPARRPPDPTMQAGLAAEGVAGSTSFNHGGTERTCQLISPEAGSPGQGVLPGDRCGTVLPGWPSQSNTSRTPHWFDSNPMGSSNRLNTPTGGPQNVTANNVVKASIREEQTSLTPPTLGKLEIPRENHKSQPTEHQPHPCGRFWGGRRQGQQYRS